MVQSWCSRGAVVVLSWALVEVKWRVLCKAEAMAMSDTVRDTQCRTMCESCAGRVVVESDRRPRLGKQRSARPVAHIAPMTSR